MMKATLVLALVAVASAQAGRVQVEGDISPPSGYEMGERTPVHEPLKLTFAVSLRNTDKLQSELMAVSDPRSARYGQHYTRTQVDEMVSPAPRDVQAVIDWLVVDEKVPREVVNYLPAGFVEVLVPAVVAERLVQCKFHKFTHTRSEYSVARCADAYSLPASVAAVVDFVGGVRRLPNMNRRDAMMMQDRDARRRKNVVFREGEQGITTPKSLHARYQTGAIKGTATNNSVCVLGFLGQYFSTLDLAEFYLLFYSDLNGFKPTIKGKQGLNPGVEAELDIQYVTAMSPFVPATFWSNPAKVANGEPILDWAIQDASEDGVPLVQSVSYGEPEYGLPATYTSRMDQEFQKLGLRGVSIILASGDSGVGCSPTDTFGPDFPATAPHATSVGAAGKSPLGFLNPFLYQNAAAFLDTTKGSNPGQDACAVGGFNAVAGWEPAMGLGEPIYPKLKAAALALP